MFFSAIFHSHNQSSCILRKQNIYKCNITVAKEGKYKKIIDKAVESHIKTKHSSKGIYAFKRFLG